MASQNIQQHEVNKDAQRLFFKSLAMVIVLAASAWDMKSVPQPGEIPDLNWNLVIYSGIVIFFFEQIFALWVFIVNFAVSLVESAAGKDFGADPGGAFDALITAVSPDGWSGDDDDDDEPQERPRRQADFSQQSTAVALDPRQQRRGRPQTRTTSRDGVIVPNIGSDRAESDLRGL